MESEMPREKLEEQCEILKKRLTQYKFITSIILEEDVDLLSIRALKTYILLKSYRCQLPLTLTEEWELLFRWTDLSQFNFYSRLYQQYPSLNKHELKFCCLFRLHFTSDEILNILGIKQSTFYTNKSNIKKIVSSKEDFEYFIKTF